tara:strand:+ start:341 stop:568 length:228 start_codon:yes stop_codon:yes gene_type:complete
MPRYKIINDARVQFSAEEETARDAEETANENAIQLQKNAETKKETDSKAGNDKLIELGLSQDQITAMTGYKPPVE